LEWLNEFQSPQDREAGLILVRKILFLSRREVLELSRVTYDSILLEIMEEIIRVKGLQRLDYARAYRSLDKFLKKCIFVGMSDGALIDYFRRHGDVIDNEQVVPYYKIDEVEKSKHKDAEYAFLIDDMCGSGTTFLRKEREASRWKLDGQLPRFLDKWKTFSRFSAIYYCPYLITQKGFNRLEALINGPRRIVNRHREFTFKILYGMRVPNDYSILSRKRTSRPLFETETDRLKVVQLCEKYYNPKVEDKHTRKGGGCKFGFGRIGTLLVRFSNTPNNTPSVLWFSDDGGQSRALFKRLSRHHD